MLRPFGRDRSREYLRSAGRAPQEMVYLTEMHKITILQMIGYGDRIRTQAEVVRLFQGKSGVAADISRYQNPHTSSRQTASAINISHSSILRVLPENPMHPYKLVPTNELAEDDFDRRILCCEQMMQMIADNTLQIENVLFSDESTFTLHGHVNRQNYHFTHTL
ncbi:hypothetical protein NQ318_010239 [Aromia moschata]|uniref:Transposase n=1 Tax=Aromia moschata TaxID=1265417 RepID=A0AAV8YHG3_9CUCU|nr:hypothetical protein NQ318_010239 [Aromia moschata]